jgi:hypothetical protein
LENLCKSYIEILCTIIANFVKCGIISKLKVEKWAGGVAQVVEDLPCKHKSLKFKPQHHQKKKKKKAEKI